MEFKIYKAYDIETQLANIEDFIKPVPNFRATAKYIIDNSSEEIVDLQELVDGETTLSKCWTSSDKQSSIGFWSIETSDAEIWAILKSEDHDGTGEIETCLVEPHEIA